MPPLKIVLSKRLPPITVDELAQMLAIDLALGRQKDFRARLRRALTAVAREGKSSPLDLMAPSPSPEQQKAFQKGTAVDNATSCQ